MVVIQETIDGVTIVVGRDSMLRCTLTNEDTTNQKNEIYLQNWPEFKTKVDELFNIVNGKCNESRNGYL
jgi:cyclopropane fatty-acyl-phospholipid synthase-like methyltransferase